MFILVSTLFYFPGKSRMIALRCEPEQLADLPCFIIRLLGKGLGSVDFFGGPLVRNWDKSGVQSTLGHIVRSPSFLLREKIGRDPWQ